MTAGALRDYLAAKEVRTKKDPAKPAKPATQCSHLETFLRNGGTSVLCPLARCCLSASYYVRPDATDATMACLSCAVLCTREEAAAHLKAAAQSAGVNPHCIFADVERAELYCAACAGYAYSPEFDRLVLGARAIVTGVETPDTGSAAATTGKKRKKAATIDISKINVVGNGAAPLASVNSHGVPRGLRGMANLGNTCFLSTVLHAVVRAPTVGGFFLKDGHNRELCTAKRDVAVAEAVNAGVLPAPEDEHCLACELDAIVAGAYSGSADPLVPSNFLHSWWMQSPEHLAKHKQHDAHEFFLSLVAAVHANLSPSERAGGAFPALGGAPPVGSKGPVSPRAGGTGGAVLVEHCKCPMHTAFAGVLRSDVTCGACGHTSTVHDPTVGLSLDVPSAANGNATGSKQSVTLEACLSQFARAEHIDSDESFPCGRCGDSTRVKTKQMAARRLPPALVLQIKRFETNFMGKAGSMKAGSKKSGLGNGDSVVIGRKIDVHVSFPFVLNMRPYCASAALRSRYGNRMRWFGNREAADTSPEDRAKYDLYAVVVHSGTMESGHYIAYVQWQGVWFRCDDHQVTRADPATVAKAQAYLLFYQTRPNAV
jgi:ubiquitin carboxyl-terminal hydrolase 22/27/51